MKDIVEEALNHQADLDSDNTTDSSGFGDPTITLVGYGKVGGEIIQQGWDNRYPEHKYPEAESYHVEGAEELPATVLDADYVILTGDTEDHNLAVEIGEALTNDITTIAIPIRTAETSVRSVETANATIPCNQDRVQELATDLLAILTGQIEISPPIRFYNELQTIGRVYGFRGQQNRVSEDISADEFAEQLVTDALANPFDRGEAENADHYISFLRAGEGVTLRESDAVRDVISEKLGDGSEREVIAVDAAKEMGTTYRLTILCE